MKIEPKMNGWAISDVNIKCFPHLLEGIITLNDIDKLSKRSAQWIFDNYNLVRLNPDIADCHFGVLMSHDDMFKVSIMESYPEIEKELMNYFNPLFGDWTKCYLRFGVWRPERKNFTKKA